MFDQCPPLVRCSRIALCIPIAGLMIVLAGCATPDDRVSGLVTSSVPESAPKVFVQVPERTWLQVDSDIGAASLAASGPARSFARVQMEAWRKLVASKVETDFTPWVLELLDPAVAECPGRLVQAEFAG